MGSGQGSSLEDLHSIKYLYHTLAPFLYGEQKNKNSYQKIIKKILYLPVERLGER